jgi:hypothetical protein
VAELVIAVFFAGMGVYALAAPAAMVGPFGVTLDTATARSEVRAVYGGFGLAIAAVLISATRVPEVRTGVLVTVGAALAGMAAGRLVSVFGERTPLYPNWFYCVVEAVGAAVLFWVL